LYDNLIANLEFRSLPV